jgi:tetratricopeptide (TPR) repeat protein
MKSFRFIASVFFLIGIVSSTWCQRKQLPFETVFKEGVDAANNRQFDKAIQLFDSLSRVDPYNKTIFFNLGNCYYDSKQFGKAIWAFEKVLKIDPRDGEATTNIELTFSKLKNGTKRTIETSGLVKLVVGIGLSFWVIFTFICALIPAIHLGYYIRFQSKNNILERFSYLSIFLFIVSFSAGYTAKNHLENVEYAVVIQPAPELNNPMNSTSKSKVLEGMEVLIVNREKEQCEVILPDGNTTIIPEASLAFI